MAANYDTTIHRKTRRVLSARKARSLGDLGGVDRIGQVHPNQARNYYNRQGGGQLTVANQTTMLRARICKMNTLQPSPNLAGNGQSYFRKLHYDPELSALIIDVSGF